MQKTNDLQRILRQAILNALNVLIEGPHGQGKSSVILTVAAEFGLRVKYFSASTLDPFADLVGIPVPVEQDGQRRLVYHQQQELLEAELLVFDELNRAHPKVLNAVYEIVQFRQVNGTPLPRLRSVIAAMNPPDNAYQVQELDPALVDRFHFYISFRPGPDDDWFKAAFGGKLGCALLDWYRTDLDQTQQAAVSPRRLEYLGRAIEKGIDATFAQPPGVKLPIHLLQLRLKEKEMAILNIEDFISNPDSFLNLVGQDLNVAVRFAQMLPMMKPAQKNMVKLVLLALPGEVLAQLLNQQPFVFRKTEEAVCHFEGAANAQAFRALLDERLQPIRVRLKDKDDASNDQSRKRPA